MNFYHQKQFNSFCSRDIVPTLVNIFSLDIITLQDFHLKCLNWILFLTHWMPVLPSYRNKSINLHRKSVDWFLYEGNTGTQWVKLIECLLVSFLISCTFYLSSVLNVIRMSMPTVFFLGELHSWIIFLQNTFFWFMI